MKIALSLVVGITGAALCFAAAESRVSRASILAVERMINEKINAYSIDPYRPLGDARGTYLEGYGVLFTNELELINIGALTLTPFKPTISKEEVAGIHERKLKKLAELKDAMRTLMMNASETLEGLPPNEHVAMEAILFSHSWEITRDMPHRVFMSAEKQQLLDAKASHAGQTELAAFIEEQER
ncbi:MAG TPA: hypothetical protein VHY84_06475 [Bryobacteraceae bacterium]|jgi:hypothetical protein|nr:hypothetical protein [Bryobacteraceae bacterium]